MPTVPVFRQGAWIHYPLPSTVNALWSQEHIFKAASLYATALSQGYSPDESAMLAEAYVNKLIFTGIQYNRSLESRLAQIMDRAERA